VHPTLLPRASRCPSPCQVGNGEIASLLLDRGADVNQQGSPERRITALMVATYHKQVWP
jgi:hypothetical protein